MITIWKFPLQITDKQTIDVPIGTSFLQAGIDPLEQLAIWGMVDTEAEKQPVNFYVVGTGNPMPEGATVYLGTIYNSPFMWHVFTESTKLTKISPE